MRPETRIIQVSKGFRMALLIAGTISLVAGVLADLRDLVGLSGTPRFIEVTRWPASLPQYELGHLQRVARIRAIEAAMPDLALIGNGYEGTGIPDVVGQGAVLAQRWA